MRNRKVPADFDCPYQRTCPHMDGISARWAFTVFTKQSQQEEHVRKVEADNEQLLAENADLKRERDQIKARFQALHRKQFKAGKTTTPPVPPDRTEQKKKRGAPPGHPPWNRPVPNHIDKVVPVLAPTVCPHCECDNLSHSSEIVDQIQEDIVIQPRPFVTCFKHDTAFCPTCRRPVYATGPGELRNCSIGPVTKSIAIWLHHKLNLPFRPVQEIFAALFGMSFVPASALNFSLGAAERGLPLYEDLREKIRASSLLHLDETSWRLDGSGGWLWYAGNKDLDFFHIDHSRSAAVIAAILGEEFGGDIVSDDYAAYNIVLARWRQVCLAHIMRTAKDIATEIGLIEDATPYSRDILFATTIAEFFSEVCSLDRKRRSGNLSRKEARAMIPNLRRRLKTICTATLVHPKTRNLRNRLLDAKRDARKLFTFLARPGMSPTNNHAERALRGPVISRKISFGSRSNSGAAAFSVLASLLGTAKRQQRSPVSFLYTLLTTNTPAARAALYRNSS